MRRTFITVAATLAAAAGLTVGAVTTSSTAQAAPGAHGQKVCADAKAGEASCHAIKLVDADGVAVDANGKPSPSASTPPATGKTPAQIRGAYNLTGSASGGRTVAIVDAYGYPNAERDLSVYRSQFGLPACTTASGCLKIVNQSGGTSLPRTDVGWSQEQALDLDAVSAACPDCKILLVQASSASFANLGAAVNTAAKASGVVAISNSYGGGDAADTSYGTYYNHPGIAVTASTGDSGYQGGSYPASSSYVTAVGGTSLKQDTTKTRGWTETVWSGAGSGCSTYNTALAAAASFGTGCAKRAMADVSAVADPNTGLAVYAPTTSTQSSWAQYGGTSLSSPLIASVYALSGNTAGYANAIPYSHTAALYDVTSGSNGSCPPPSGATPAPAGTDPPVSARPTGSAPSDQLTHPHHARPAPPRGRPRRVLGGNSPAARDATRAYSFEIEALAFVRWSLTVDVTHARRGPVLRRPARARLAPGLSLRFREPHRVRARPDVRRRPDHHPPQPPPRDRPHRGAGQRGVRPHLAPAGRQPGHRRPARGHRYRRGRVRQQLVDDPRAHPRRPGRVREHPRRPGVRAGQQDRLDRTVTAAILLAGGAGVFAAVPLLLWGTPLMRLVGASETVAATGGGYLGFLGLALVPIVVGGLLSGVLRSTGKARSPMLATMGTVGLNAALAFALVTGFWPFPTLGVVGAGVATLVTATIKTGILALQLFVLHRIVTWELPRTLEAGPPGGLGPSSSWPSRSASPSCSGPAARSSTTSSSSASATPPSQRPRSSTCWRRCSSSAASVSMSATTALVGREVGRGDAVAAAAWVRRIKKSARSADRVRPALRRHGPAPAVLFPHTVTGCARHGRRWASPCTASSRS